MTISNGGQKDEEIEQKTVQQLNREERRRLRRRASGCIYQKGKRPERSQNFDDDKLFLKATASELDTEWVVWCKVLINLLLFTVSTRKVRELFCNNSSRNAEIVLTKSTVKIWTTS